MPITEVEKIRNAASARRWRSICVRARRDSHQDSEAEEHQQHQYERRVPLVAKVVAHGDHVGVLDCKTQAPAGKRDLDYPEEKTHRLTLTQEKRTAKACGAKIRKDNALPRTRDSLFG